MPQPGAILDRMMDVLGLRAALSRAPVARWESALPEAGPAQPRRDAAPARVSIVGSYYAFRRELDRHDPDAPGSRQDAASRAAWQQDFRPGGRADAIAESHFGHPLASPVVRFVLQGDHGALARIELTWRGHHAARVIWTEQAGLADS